MENSVVTFRCRFRRFSTYLKNGKRIRFADGTYRTSDPAIIEFLRKNYRPPMMSEVKESEAFAAAVSTQKNEEQKEPEKKPASNVPPFFPGQGDALASLAVPPAEPQPETKKAGSKK